MTAVHTDCVSRMDDGPVRRLCPHLFAFDERMMLAVGGGGGVTEGGQRVTKGQGRRWGAVQRRGPRRAACARVRGYLHGDSGAATVAGVPFRGLRPGLQKAKQNTAGCRSG